ncbi:MAG: hypothetical protein JRN35_08575 [Nitrososphaerota archaeon]|nr:hypothetical protein [Nitrososphaerota archaeon]
MTDWIEWTNLGLGIVGAVGTVGIFILVWQWWKDNHSKAPYDMQIASGRPGDGAFFNVAVRLTSQTTHSLKFLLFVQVMYPFQEGSSVRWDWATPPQQMMEDAVMRPIDMVHVRGKDIGDVRIRVENIQGAAVRQEVRLMVLETVRGGNPIYKTVVLPPLPKRV